jgi:outer membrane receptor protein involved in Fe transport
VGFNITWRWQDSFEWKATLANGVIPAYSTLDAQVNFSIPKMHVNTKLGGTNILNERYRQYEGGPTIGAFYYFAVSIDGLLTK